MNQSLSNYSLNELSRALGVDYSGEDMDFSGVSTDTRNIETGDVFVALKGPNFDAHDYLDQAKEKGAIAAVVDRDVDSTLPQIKVENTLTALGKMASARRQSFSGKVIGLTGSNGKTTVKELIASILSTNGKVLATRGNFNNDIGLPLTLLRLENDEQYAVIEMGANHPGEIDYLTHVTQPDIALITNAGAAHLEGFGSVEGVSRAKGEIFSGLSGNGVAIINADDKYADYWLSISKGNTQKTFSLENEKADVFASNVEQQHGSSTFNINVKNKGVVNVKLPLSGKHNVANALVAATVASVCDLTLDQIKAGLESFNTVQGRLTFLKGAEKSCVIDDTYNANLDSSKAAINVLSEQSGEKYFVFGDLFESGDNATVIHQKIGQYAKEKNIDHLLAVGELTQLTVDAFGEGAVHFNNKNELADYLFPMLGEESVVLVKGSRGMRMEEIVTRLVE